MSKITAYNIQRRLILDAYYRGSFTCPNYTPKDWWECDLMELRKSGFWVEYEVKLSRADFMADRRKIERKFDYNFGEYRERNKHICLDSGMPCGPNYFWFVVPHGMIRLDDVPRWAGLQWATEESYLPSQFPVNCKVVKRAPRLHIGKIEDAVRNHLLRTYYHRFQHWFLFKKAA